LNPYRQSDSSARDLPYPRCKGSLTPIKEKKLVGRRCNWCLGVWLDAEVFDEVLDHELTRALLAKPPEVRWVDDGQTVRCSQCDAWMTRQVVWSKPSVIVDHCEHGIWLDRGELEALVAAFPPGTIHPLETEAPKSKDRTRPLSVWDLILSVLFGRRWWWP
jgi:Zn-finger nucleic acid-binding protein